MVKPQQLCFLLSFAGLLLVAAMSEAGVVSGTVTHSTTGEPIQQFSYNIYDFGERRIRYFGGADAGKFKVTGIEPGTYTLVITGSTIVDRILGGFDCEPTAESFCNNIEVGTPIEVPEEGEVTGLDFVVDRLGIITGRVSGGLDFLRVDAFSSKDFSRVTGDVVFGGGAYTLEGLNNGSYVVLVSGEEIIDQLYNGVACVQEITLESCDNLAEGDRVSVGINTIVEDLDFDLQLGGSISGTVFDIVSGEPVEGAQVHVWDAAGRHRGSNEAAGFGGTDSEGRYKVTGLNPGTYTATAPGSRVFNQQLYAGLECPGTGFERELCDVTAGTPIVVTAATDTPGIDFVLRPRGSIAGRVTDAATGEPLTRVTIDVFDSEGLRVAHDQPNRNGEYQVGGLDAGIYFAYARVFSGSSYVSEIYDEIPCPFYFAPCGPSRVGAPISVVTDSVTESIDFSLDQGGTISGQVTDATSGEALNSFDVTVWTADGIRVGSTGGDSSGHFRFPEAFRGLGLASGSYYVTVDDAADYLGEVWGGAYCLRAGGERCDLSSGMPIAVQVGRDTPGIDFALDRAGSIEGKVTHALTGGPLPVNIEIWDSLGVFRSARTDEEGCYYATGLPAGSFVVSTKSSPYWDQVFPGRPCPSDRCDFNLGEPVTVALATATAGVDFSLNSLGRISGRVTAAPGGEPLELAYIQLWDPTHVRAEVLTSANGAFTLSGLVPDTYYLTADSPFDLRWIPELYDGLTCPRGFFACDVTTGSGIAVQLDSTVEGIEIALERAGTVSGRVVDAATGEALESNNASHVVELEALIYLYNAQGERVGRGFAGRDGHYRIQGLTRALHAGRYFAFVDSLDYVHQVYPGVNCPRFDFLSCDLSQATPVIVANATERPGVDFALELGGSISGRVTASETGEPIREASVWARDAAGIRVGGRLTRDDGSYRLPGLPAGSYYLTVEHSDFEDQLHPGLPCAEGDCEITDGTLIAVVPEAQVENFDFILSTPSPCDPDTELCLLDDAFKVTATWRDAAGRTGVGRARQLSDSSGAFWFFDPDNLEVIIKVLDACGTTFDSYWVFVAGLTNIEVDLQVTHLASGLNWSSTNPLGTSFAPVLDVEGISACTVSSSSAASAGPTSTEAVPLPLELFGNPVRNGPCTPTSTSLCLADRRFRVEALWRRSNDETGIAMGQPLTDGTGIFWFFSPDNLEVIVKVLNACESFGNFWVFAAGLTDVEVRLRVTDLVSNEIRDYFNPLGMVYEPIQDTSAFATCP